MVGVRSDDLVRSRLEFDGAIILRDEANLRRAGHLKSDDGSEMVKRGEAWASEVAKHHTLPEIIKLIWRIKGRVKFPGCAVTWVGWLFEGVTARDGNTFWN